MSASPRRPLTVWELPKLLEPVHRHRPAVVMSPKDRPHFSAILAFVYRNRFAIAQQIQRRFGQYLPSDRTARRQLAEMEALGYLDLVPTLGVSPLFPKVYSVSRKGLRRLREAFAKKGKDWKEPISDRRRSEGYSALHVMHELCITEFLLEKWEESQSHPDFELLQVERRSLTRHPAFIVTIAGRRQRLIPDAMYLYREPRGMMCCFLEIDMGTMSPPQMEEKFRRYEAWKQSADGEDYLMQLYCDCGASSPRPTFRIHFSTINRTGRFDSDRAAALLATTKECGPSLSVACRAARDANSNRRPV